MNFENSGGWSRRSGSACVIKLLMVLQRFLKTMLDLIPGALVERLFLTPDDFLDVSVFVKQLGVLR